MSEEDVQTEAVEANTEEVQVDQPPTAEKGTSERFSINKVQIRKVKPPVYKKTDLEENYLTTVPVLCDKQAEYVPMPYTFRVPGLRTPVKITNLLARSPPFYLLLDHSIAVIWLLFAEKEYNCPLGIAQLQWALSFMRTIHTRQGDYPKDVELCIDAIEEILLNQYAELSKQMAPMNKLDESVHYAEGAFGSNTMVSENIPFSLNYDEMIRKCSATIDAHGTMSMTSIEAEEELERIKKAAGVKSIEKLDSVSRDKAINVLKMWKTDQVEKIREELRRLRNIEDNLRDIDQNFDGYIEDDLEKLTGE